MPGFGCGESWERSDHAMTLWIQTANVWELADAQCCITLWATTCTMRCRFVFWHLILLATNELDDCGRPIYLQKGDFCHSTCSGPITVPFIVLNNMLVYTIINKLPTLLPPLLQKQQTQPTPQCRMFRRWGSLPWLMHGANTSCCPTCNW